MIWYTLYFCSTVQEMAQHSLSLLKSTLLYKVAVPWPSALTTIPCTTQRAEELPLRELAQHSNVEDGSQGQDGGHEIRSRSTPRTTWRDGKRRETRKPRMEVGKLEVVRPNAIRAPPSLFPARDGNAPQFCGRQRRRRKRGCAANAVPPAVLQRGVVGGVVSGAVASAAVRSF